MNPNSANPATSFQTMQRLDRIAGELALVRGEPDARGMETEAFVAPKTAASSDPDVISFFEPRYGVGAYRFSVLAHAITAAKRARRDTALGATPRAKR
jgi:hypothetical protein